MNRFRSPAAMGVLGFSVRLGVAFLSLPGPALAAVCTWEGGDSVWSTPGNWSCAAVPGNADDALLNTDNNLDLDVAATVQKFTLASASAVLQGSGTLTSNSAFDLRSGTVSGSGVLTSNTTYNLQSGSIETALAGNVGINKTTAGTVTLSGDNSYTGTIQVNAGTLIFNGSGNHTLTGSYTDAGALEFRRHQPVRDRRDNRHHQFDLQRR